MFMNRSLNLAAAAVAVCTLYIHPASAAVFQPRVSVGVQDYELGFADVISANATGSHFFRDGFEISDQVSFVGLGLTLSTGRLFFDVSGQRSETGHDQTTQFQGVATGSGFTGGNGHNHNLAATFDRDEFNATVGWGVTDQFSAYVGYKHAQVDLENQLSPALPPVPDPGDVLFLGSRIIDFNYDGAFIGATYSVPVDSWGGAFSVQSSVAFLDGSFKEHFEGAVAIFVNPSQVTPLNPSFINGEIDGKSKGLNVGVSWTGGFGWLSKSLGGLSYTIGVDRSEYDFETKQSSTGNFEEKYTRVRLDLRYRFQTGGT